MVSLLRKICFVRHLPKTWFAHRRDQFPVLPPPLNTLLSHFRQLLVTKVSENSPHRSCWQGREDSSCFRYGRTCFSTVILGLQHSSRNKTYCCQKSHQMGFDTALKKPQSIFNYSLHRFQIISLNNLGNSWQTTVL